MGDTALKIAQLGLEDKYTSGANSVFNGGSAVRATRRLAVEKSIGNDHKLVWESPEEARGTYAGSYQHVLHMRSAAGKIPAEVYCDDLIWYLRMAVSGVPTVTTLPNAPTALLAATNIATTLSLTTQPNAAADGAAAKILAITLSNAAPSSTPVVVTLTGTDVNGNALVETVTFTAGTTTTSYTGGGPSALTVTLYTQNYFATVGSGGLATSAQPAGDQVAVGGVNAFQYVFLNDMTSSSLYSGTMEYFDGSASWQLPGVVMEKFGLNMSIGKSFKGDFSFSSRDKVLLPAASGSINSGANSGDYNALTNLKDMAGQAAIPSYKSLFYAGNLGTAPGSLTQIAARLTEFKFDVETGAKLGKAADGTALPTFVGRSFYKISGEFTLLFNSYSGNTADPVEVTNFLTYQSRTVRMAIPGVPLPCGIVSGTSNWPTSLQSGSSGGLYGVMVDLPGKYTEIAEKEVEGRMALSFKLASEVDLVSLNAACQVTVISRINPNFI